jgi:NADH-quinone oxidoreductase subunit E
MSDRASSSDPAVDLPEDGVARFDALLVPVLQRYPPDHKPAAMIPALRLGQKIFGHLSPAVQKLAADRLGTSAARAQGVATFYQMFDTERTGRHVVELCTNVSCCLAGAERILEELKGRLEVKIGGTTADDRITLREVECLGCCGTAPAMLVDEEQHEQLSVEKVLTILEGLE